MPTTDEDTKWFWCLKHDAAEYGITCPVKDRLGPYDSADEAAGWRERVERRNQEWENEDERWEGGGR